MDVGVLAVQGDFREHRAKLQRLGANVAEVRLPEHLHGLDGLVIPGGESTTISKLMRTYGLDDALRSFEGTVFGTCAGMILLARDVIDGVPDQLAFGALDIVVRRNGYGRQVASFEADVTLVGDPVPLRGVFIRAPRIEEFAAGVEVLAELDDDAVLVRRGRYLAASFHPELTDDLRVHQMFLASVGRSRSAGLHASNGGLRVRA